MNEHKELSLLSPEELDALEALAQAATPGPWGLIPKGGPQGNYFGVWNPQKGWIVLDRVLNIQGEGDASATYIAAANPETVLRLLADVRRYRAALEAAKLRLEQQFPQLLEIKDLPRYVAVVEGKGTELPAAHEYLQLREVLGMEVQRG